MSGCGVGCRAEQAPAGHTQAQGLAALWTAGGGMSAEAMVVPDDFPNGVVALHVWRHANVDCAVGSLGRRLYGLARVASAKRGWTRYERAQHLDGTAAHTLAPENLGEWAAFDVGPISRYWAHEVRARFVSGMSPELVAWDQQGHAWMVEKVRHEVNEFVDAVLRAVPRQRQGDEAVGTHPPRHEQYGSGRSLIDLPDHTFDTRPRDALQIPSDG